jgi:hypothetical protein
MPTAALRPPRGLPEVSVTGDDCDRNANYAAISGICTVCDSAKRDPVDKAWPLGFLRSWSLPKRRL